MPTDDIIERARVLLCLNPQGIVCGGTLDIDRLLRDRLPQAMWEVADEVAAGETELLAACARPFTGKVTWHPLGEKWWGEVTLPADFLRLVAFEMSDWRRPAEVITPHTPRYALQRSRYSGVGGCPERPVVAVVPGAGGQRLEFYACRCCAATVETALYLPRPTWDGGDAVDWPPEFCDRVAVRLALLAAESLDKAPIA